jgi:hypothetical protein
MSAIHLIKSAPPLSARKSFCVWLAAALVCFATAMPAFSQVPSPLNIRAVDRGTEQYNTTAAADAATEKVIQSLAADFQSGGEALVSNNISYYESLYPNATDDPYWGNYSFTSPATGAPGTWVGLLSTNPVVLPGLAPGSYVYGSTYRIAANAQLTNGGTGLTAAVWQDLALAYMVPPTNLSVFQYAIFYNGTLEFSDCATMTVNGRVHCNSNINVGCTSASTLTFNYFVDLAGIITNPPALGIAQANWVASHIIYNGLPSPGYGTGEQVISFLGAFTNIDTTSSREIINPPPVGESTSSPVSAQRYYNKADLVITITNAVVGTNLVTDTNGVLATNSVTVYVKNSMYDTNPLVFAVTNGVMSGINNGVDNGQAWQNWVAEGFTNWLSLTNTFYDQRQGAYQHVVQIDVGNLGQWIGTSTACTNVFLTGKWNATTPFNGIIYIQDLRTTNAQWQNCVRLVNGQNITNGLYASGLSVATQNPLYIMGLYNCPGTNNVSSTNTSGCRLCSVICDALTILSPNWQTAGYDSPTLSGPGISYAERSASANDTVNTAIIAGNVQTTSTTATGFSGGVHNLPRLLEDWSGDNLWLNTSIVCLYTSEQATVQFQAPGNYYEPPTRHFSFDQNFLNVNNLPPGTPMQPFVLRLDRLTPSPAANPSQ